MKHDFRQKTVLITGASLGVGRATAHAFAQAGANVVLNARRREPLEKAAEGLDHALVLPFDVSDVEAAREALTRIRDHFGGLHGLVNNAGAHFRGPLNTRTPEEVGMMVDVNLRAPLVLTRLVLDDLMVDGGFVVNLASLAGKVPLDGAATYSATKFGLRAFTYALAQELVGTNVTVSAVSPGPIDTGFIMDALDEVEDITFSQAICSAEDVATMVLDCATDGRVEREYPVAGGKLATLAYLVPKLRQALKPMLAAKGRRVKERLRAERGDVTNEE